MIHTIMRVLILVSKIAAKSGLAALVALVMVGSLFLSGCLTPEGNRFGQSLVKDYARASVVRDAQNRSDARYQNGRSGGQRRYYDGKMTDGGYYKGDFLNNYPHGFGSYTYPSGNKYVGQFRNGKRDGQGTYAFASGTKYVGQLRDGKPDGQGTYTYASGDKYVGQFRDGKRDDGQGTYTFANGNKYVGQFKSGKFDGQGTYTYANGTFVGEMVENRTHKGTFTGKDGTIIAGTFQKGTLAGSITYPDGRRYEGEWNGDGEFLGVAAIPGHWTYERPHGIGRMTHPNGTTDYGLWDKGKFVGELIKKADG